MIKQMTSEELKNLILHGNKEIIKEGMSESSINRMRKRAIKKIIQRWEKDNQAER